MLLIEFLCFDSVSLRTLERGVWSLDMERERAYLLTPTRAYTRLIDLFVQSHSASSRTVWRGSKERLVNSVILIAVSPLRGFL